MITFNFKKPTFAPFWASLKLSMKNQAPQGVVQNIRAAPDVNKKRHFQGLGPAPSLLHDYETATSGKNQKITQSYTALTQMDKLTNRGTD